MKPKIKHIWFDFSYTLAAPDDEAHTKLIYETYAAVVKKPVSPELIQEYDLLYAKSKSHSGTFTAMGLGPDFWAGHVGNLELKLIEEGTPDTLNQLRSIVPISIWSNIHAERMLPALNIDPTWFTFILGPKEVKNPKPALDGFQLILEKSSLPAENILFVGDSVEKEMRPAKSMGIQTCLMWKQSPEPDYCLTTFKELLALVR